MTLLLQRFLAWWAAQRWWPAVWRWLKAARARHRSWDAERRRRAQRRDLRVRMLQVMIRLDEARCYVDRDRRAERAERDRLVRQLDAARARQAELEELLRTYMVGQTLIDAEAAAGRAREALVSGFGDLTAES